MRHPAERANLDSRCPLPDGPTLSPLRSMGSETSQAPVPSLGQNPATRTDPLWVQWTRAHRQAACRFLTLQLAAVLLCLVWGIAAADPDDAAREPYLVGEYKFPALIDSAVATETFTELWAVVYRPRRNGRFPLLVFLHGNHGTCGLYDPALGVRLDDGIEYTETGTCPEGWIPTPNHLGYGYLAATLAKNGFVVVSINANRGVNAAAGVPGDPGLNLRRGRLVLRHLQQLARWSAGKEPSPGSLGFSLRGLLDLRNVGLFGHSRGGEGMRAAMAQYRDEGSPWPSRIGKLGFQALFEVGPVDGQTGRILDAEGVAWNVLLPACDGDVSSLKGVRPFDRMIMRSNDSMTLAKSTFQVFGANHNFYNTEWQVSDAQECPGQPMLFPQYGGSPSQRKTAEETVIPFFLAHVGERKTPIFAKRFDPSQPIPRELSAITYYARGHSNSLRPTPNFIIDDFTQETGISSRGAGNVAYQLDSYAHGNAGSSHDATQRAATLEWSANGAYFQVNAADTRVRLNRDDYASLEFRVKLECFDALCSQTINPAGDVDFSIRIVNGDGRLSLPVNLSAFARVYRPVSAYSSYDYHNSLFQTVRIPLQAFYGTDITNFRGVRFSFDRSPRARVSLGNVRLVQARAGSAPLTGMPRIAMQEPRVQHTMKSATEKSGRATVRHTVRGAGAGASTSSPTVEIALESNQRFPVADALPSLRIGDREFQLFRFEGGNTDRITFVLPDSDYRALPQGAPVLLQMGEGQVWDFGALQKPAG